MLTGGTSGVYYPLGVALSEIYAEGIEGARTQVQATKASVENLNLLQQGKGEIAFSLGDSVKARRGGRHRGGLPRAARQAARHRRDLPELHPDRRHARTPASETLADLKGKRLSVGAPTSGTELNARAIFAAAGMSYDDLGQVEYLPFAESVELMKNRQLDATLQSAGLGVASIRDLATSVPITVVAVPPEIVEKIGAPYVAATIPAGTYDGQDGGRADRGGRQLPRHPRRRLRRDRLRDDQARSSTTSTSSRAAHAAAKAIDPAKALDGMPVPLHPGAERYYRRRAC